MPLTLSTPVGSYFRITAIQKAALAKLGIHTVEDLLYHFPVRYGDTAEARSIDSLAQGDTAVIFGKISGLKTSKGFKSRIAMADGYVEDETGRIHCVWFNQPYVAKMYTDGMMVRIEGKVSAKRKKDQAARDKSASAGEISASPLLVSARVGDSPAEATISPSQLYFSNPKIEQVDKLPTGVGDSLFGDDSEAHTLYPVYPETRGVTSAWIYHALQKVFKSGLLEQLPEFIPAEILEKYHLPTRKSALIWIHTPLKHDDALSARKRFAFEEIFVIQLGMQQTRLEYAAHPSFVIETEDRHVQEFIRRFPFQATSAQVSAVNTIVADMKKDQAMSRLLEGDVGSGKTAVAAATTYAVVTSKAHEREKKATSENVSAAAQGNSSFSALTASGKKKSSPARLPSIPAPIPAPTLYQNLQVAYMCPTEILATQHFESFIQYFTYLGVQIGLITGSGCRKYPSKVNPKGWTDISRAQLLKWVESGDIHILIGTHALIQKSVQFKNLAFVIIDEQHRFGTAQRSKLIRKDHIAPHLLSMTATPIPRTLSLTLYGDLDLTLLDQAPEGRKPIITKLVLPNHREEMYAELRRELHLGRQVFIICPRIDEPDPDKEAALIATSVKAEAKRLKATIFSEFEIGILHSRMSPKEKDQVMNEFKDGKIHILCATSVVEVGVNVPNATAIVIEGAERFGLAQLHQLRGRVMRSSHQAYCYAVSNTKSAKSIDRLKALQTAKNGFELAELDLAQRGAGELSGARQWGVSDVAMEALKNLKMVEAARTEAARLIAEDAKLSNYPILRSKVESSRKEAHFE